MSCANISRSLVGVATTCLAETIGEDLPRLLDDFRRENGQLTSPIVHVSTASYRGTHIDGFHGAVRALVDQLATKPHGLFSRSINLFPGMLSAADLRHLKEILEDYALPFTLLPDYSETMDGETWEHYKSSKPGNARRRNLRAWATPSLH